MGRTRGEKIMADISLCSKPDFSNICNTCKRNPKYHAESEQQSYMTPEIDFGLGGTEDRPTIGFECKSYWTIIDNGD
jgi:hypothetical protein